MGKLSIWACLREEITQRVVFEGGGFEKKKKNKQKDHHWFSLCSANPWTQELTGYRDQWRCRTPPVLSAVTAKLQDLHLPSKREENIENIFKFCENKSSIKFLYLPFVQWVWSCPACPYFAFSFVMHYATEFW